MAILSTYPNISDPYKAGTHSGLDFAYGAGTVRDNNTISTTTAGTTTLADDDVSYIEVDPRTGTVSDNITGFTVGSIPLYEVTTASGAITVVTDKRSFLSGNKETLAINTQTASYTLVLGDDSKLVDMVLTAALTLTVPKNSAVAFPIGTQIIVRQKGTGQVTIAPVDGDVTLNSAGPALKTVDQYSLAGMIKVAINTWAVFGDLEA